MLTQIINAVAAAEGQKFLTLSLNADAISPIYLKRVEAREYDSGALQAYDMVQLYLSDSRQDVQRLKKANLYQGFIIWEGYIKIDQVIDLKARFLRVPAGSFYELRCLWEK